MSQIRQAMATYPTNHHESPTAFIDIVRFRSVYTQVRNHLLNERVSEGHWVGELAASALATATAVSALAVAKNNRTRADSASPARNADDQMILQGLSWLTTHQNEDGGWGDTCDCHSNIATTMLVEAAFHLAGVTNSQHSMLSNARRYIDQCGGVEALRKRYGKDRTFAVPILTNCALAGNVSWEEVARLPFELACLPQSWYRFLGLPVVSYAIPALIAIGQAVEYHHRTPNPFIRFIRNAAWHPVDRVLEQIQPLSGGFLEAIPLTSFVVMSLASTERADATVTRRGLDFLRNTVRPDGSWPIDTNLATWNTTLTINALTAAGEDVGQLDCWDWLLSCQYDKVHPYTGTPPGGWGWSDLDGAVPDADDTSGALLALAAWRDSPSFDMARLEELEHSARAGINWLLRLQNRDGGWPTFCRGWGKLPFDRSGTDLTAHTLRALYAWRDLLSSRQFRRAVRRGMKFLERHQNQRGYWLPLWFGNQDHPQQENPVYGTAKVLMAYRDLGYWDSEPAQRAVKWLISRQDKDGGFHSGPLKSGRSLEKKDTTGLLANIEETAVAVEALLAMHREPMIQPTLLKGLLWLTRQVENQPKMQASPIGFYFAKLWYDERLYPVIFTTSALGSAVANFSNLSTRGPCPNDILPSR